MSGAIIELQGLRKSFGAVEAVKGIDLSIERGGCIGLLGPNGAGKTTTMRMIMGLTRPSGGALRVLGRQLAGPGAESAGSLGRDEKAKIGLVPQETNLDPDLSVVKNLEIYGRYFAVPPDERRRRVDRLLAFMQLEEKRHARVMELSGGMKRRLIIARALIGEPELVILDEPTTGLDPQARVLIWKQLLRLKAEGRTLLLTTHYMDEAERLCDRIVIIDGGQILDQGAPRELIARHVCRHVFELRKPVPEHVLTNGLDVEDLGDAVLIYARTPEDVIDRLPDASTYYHRPANLEDVFLRLTGRQLREGP